MRISHVVRPARSLLQRQPQLSFRPPHVVRQFATSGGSRAVAVGRVKGFTSIVGKGAVVGGTVFAAILVKHQLSQGAALAEAQVHRYVKSAGKNVHAGVQSICDNIKKLVFFFLLPSFLFIYIFKNPLT